MKEIIYKIALLATIFIVSTMTAKADNVKFYVYITITDNCSPPSYNGAYCVQWRLTYQGSPNPLCTVTLCTLRKGDNGCIEFECNVPDQTSQPYYGIEFVSAARYPSGDCYPGSGTGSSGLYWDDVTNPNCVATLSVTL